MSNYTAIRNYLSFDDLIKKSNYKMYGSFVSVLGKSLCRIKKHIKARCK